jgi:hypothetical protein
MAGSGGGLLDLLQGDRAPVLAPQLALQLARLAFLARCGVVPAIRGESAGEGERAQERERASYVLSPYAYTA